MKETKLSEIMLGSEASCSQQSKKGILTDYMKNSERQNSLLPDD